MKADKELDCLGLYCPVPIMKTAQLIKTMNSGEILEVTADDIGIIKDMPAWAKTTGNEFLGSKTEGDVHKVYVKKK
ncbi:MAG: sulfurtransferase TusA family protein [Candidatus Firestonebacteria bacterium]|nr:sulfurtransferase TusA family protein [Candidatus Firestonebacteria bacterium]